jgi:DNA-binding XRE family transcriptional regulator
MGALGNCVGRKRAAAGLRQQDLASRVGVSRQSLSVLEAGHTVPSAALALRLARELGCKVEEIFWTDDRQTPLAVELAADDLEGPAASRVTRAKGGAKTPLSPWQASTNARVVLASIAGRWVAHRLATTDSGAS